MLGLIQLCAVVTSHEILQFILTLIYESFGCKIIQVMNEGFYLSEWVEFVEATVKLYIRSYTLMPTSVLSFCVTEETVLVHIVKKWEWQE